MSQQSSHYVKGHTDLLMLPNNPYPLFLMEKPTFWILYNRRRGMFNWGQPVPATRSQIKSSDNISSRLRGRVKWFNSIKGYGYITPEDGTHDILLPQAEDSCEKQPIKSLFHQGDCVEFEVLSNQHHRPTATNVCRIPDLNEKHGRIKKEL